MWPCLLSEYVQWFHNTLVLPTLTAQTAIFGILYSVSNNSLFENNRVFANHILLIRKLYIYKSRENKFIENKFITINILIVGIRKVKKMEKEIALNYSKKTNVFTKQWRPTNNMISITWTVCKNHFFLIIVIHIIWTIIRKITSYCRKISDKKD